jgi:hypothetical protein
LFANGKVFEIATEFSQQVEDVLRVFFPVAMAAAFV